MARVTVVDSAQAVAATAADHLTSLIEQSIEDRARARVCLTGGRTARRLYERLANPVGPQRIDWSRVQLFWGDERHVPPDDPESNFGMAQRTLLARVAIPASQIHRMRGELRDPAVAASEYEAVLLQCAGKDPMFDVMLLSLGEDAHVASVFPGSPLLHDRGAGLVRAIPQEKGPWRMTLSPRALVDADAILALASGNAKADALRAALEPPDDVVRWPAQLLRTAGERVEWVVDREAASGLSAIR